MRRTLLGVSRFNQKFNAFENDSVQGELVYREISWQRRERDGKCVALCRSLLSLYDKSARAGKKVINGLGCWYAIAIRWSRCPTCINNSIKSTTRMRPSGRGVWSQYKIARTISATSEQTRCTVEQIEEPAVHLLKNQFPRIDIYERYISFQVSTALDSSEINKIVKLTCYRFFFSQIINI